MTRPNRDDDLLTREEVLGGLPARRAQTLLYLIENRAAHLAARARLVHSPAASEEASEEQELAFLEAFALGRDPPLRPSIQDLEHYAGEWSRLAPESPNVRAALAHLIGQKYTLTRAAVPGLRAALGLDLEPVQQAYQRLYRQPLDSIYSARPGLVERLRWAWHRFSVWLESLPPFWMAFSLTLTETIGASILALPIAMSGVGPLPAVALLVLLGLVNILTISHIAETLARTGSIRYGHAFFGRVVSEYLGKTGSLVFTLALAALTFIVLLAYYIGFSVTVAGATRIPAEIWALVLFLIGLYFLRGKSLGGTLASALFVGAINIVLILVLSLLAFGRFNAENLAYWNLPLLGGRPYDASIFELVFGVALSAYFGHTSIANGAKVVLQRDPSAGSLIRGSATAQVAAIVLYVVWVLAVGGAIPVEELSQQSGTALSPLAARVGPAVHVFGVVFVVLALGMASVHLSMGSFNLVRERLPKRHHPLVMLPRRRGRLVFRLPGGETSLGLVYLGIDGGQTLFRLDAQSGNSTNSKEVSASGQWDAGALFAQLLGQERLRVSLKVEVLEANPGAARVRVATNLKISYEGELDAAGLEMGDLLSLPDEQRQVAHLLARGGALSLADLKVRTGLLETDLRRRLEVLEQSGYIQRLERGGETRYRLQLAFKKGRQLSEKIWQALEDRQDERPQPAGLGRLAGLLRKAWAEGLSERALFLLGILPLTLIFVLAEWTLITNTESFSRPLSFVGVIVVTLLGGAFPVLLLHASRRRGEITPGVVYRFLDNPAILAGIYVLSLANLFLHGLVIWENPVERVIALASGAIMLAVTAVIIRRGSFKPRLVLELRVEPGEPRRLAYRCSLQGKPVPLQLAVVCPDGKEILYTEENGYPAFDPLCYAYFHINSGEVGELHVWAHQMTPEGDSESLPAVLELDGESGGQQWDLQLTGGRAQILFDKDKVASGFSGKVRFQNRLTRADG